MLLRLLRVFESAAHFYLFERSPARRSIRSQTAQPWASWAFRAVSTTSSRGRKDPVRALLAPMSGEDFHLEPSRFPQRLDLELDPLVIQRLQELADRSGRSISEVATELLGRQMGDRHLPD